VNRASNTSDSGGRVERGLWAGQTNCCYARSEKSWIDDPAGIAWEAFLTTGESTDYGEATSERAARLARAAANSGKPAEGSTVESVCAGRINPPKAGYAFG
jgi:hypothetical protein